MSRIAAFFDIDGTIYREGLITEVFKKIIKYELVDKEKWENEVRPAYISWDKRQGDYDTYLLKMVDIYMEAIIVIAYLLQYNNSYVTFTYCDSGNIIFKYFAFICFLIFLELIVDVIYS